LFADALAIVLHAVENVARPPIDAGLRWLFLANGLLLWWRLAVRMRFTGRTYGVREAFWSLPRFIVGNFVALAAAPRAIIRYLLILRGRPVMWDKTRHVFPDMAPPP